MAGEAALSSSETRADRSALKAKLGECPLIAVLRWIMPHEVEAVGEALIAAGFRLIEVPLNSPEPYESNRRLSQRCGNDVLIGAGNPRPARITAKSRNNETHHQAILSPAGRQHCRLIQVAASVISSQ
jgi:hypothetical protein